MRTPAHPHHASANDARDPFVLIIDADPEARSRLVDLCRSVSLQALPFEHPSVFLQAVTPQSRGCVIADIRLPGMTGLQLQQTIWQRGIHLPLILMTSDPDMRTAIDAIRRGAFNILEKSCSSQLILDEVLRAVSWDRTHSATCYRVAAIRDRLAQLTQREREVLQLLVQGKTTKQAALSLGLSAKTVENHRNRIMDKTQAHGFATLIRDVWEGVHGDLTRLEETRGPLPTDTRPLAAMLPC